MIKIGIIGYGNLGRGVELAVSQQDDLELVAIFSRRGKNGVTPVDSTVTVEHVDEIPAYQGKIDVMILCGGSATDLPEQTPEYTKYFNTVDSFDNHSQVPTHFETVNDIALENNKVSVISTGWDPGLFSLMRVLMESILPKGETNTFWGKGVSQGHSDAVRRVSGVKRAVQYTIPSEDAMNKVRSGQGSSLTTRDKHLRECYVVAETDADKAEIKENIVSMPAYFADYETIVHFIDEETFERDHSSMPHGGFVIRSGETTKESRQLIEFSLALESNPEFTASVLTACARAAYYLNEKEDFGAKTILDIPVRYLVNKPYSELLQKFV
ncbi:diaminopimelate dehydrogenase [Aerococcaceae bacterium DSM 111176]|nr:diaminopimelate dehydrogenase [Aerococcaceae bacterium DSM 111176]